MKLSVLYSLTLVVVGFSFVMALSSGSRIISCSFLTQRIQCGNWACDSEKLVCIPCVKDSQCYPSGMYCDADSGTCKLRGFFRLSSLAAVLVAVCVGAVAVIAGVGGGGILVPMFTALMQVPMKTAVGLSQSTICGQSSLNVYLLANRKFPDSRWERPLINYQYLCLLLPLGLVGTHLGGMLSKICSDFLRLVLLFALLSVVLYSTVKKVKAQYAADQERNQADVVVTNSNSSEAATGPRVSGAPEEPSSVSTKAPQEQLPMQLIISCVVEFLVLLLCEIFMRFSNCGSFFYWCFAVAPVVILLALFYRDRQMMAQLAATESERLTFEWSPKSSVYYPLVAVIAGAGAAMLGIGGGLVLGFVLYEVLTPEEASATSGAATFFISFSSAIPQVLAGTLPLNYGVMLFLVGFASTSLGQFVLMDYIRKNGLRYLIVGSLALIVGGSLLVLGGYGIYNAIVVFRTGASLFAAGKLCT